MRTLYVSDLDGTLLRSDEKISEYTISVINQLVQKGVLFSYATARSYVTASKITERINVPIPLIVYNGVFIADHLTGSILASCFFDKEIIILIKDLIANNVMPIVYSIIEGRETFSYIYEQSTPAMQAFINTRQGDRRQRPVHEVSELLEGDIFYITCIDDTHKLETLYKKYCNEHNTIYQRDVYTGEQWREFMPKNASKANAALQLKKALGCERLVVFGDGKNDIDLFRVADECYAVHNATDELKKIATGIIASNNEDGVAKWLVEHNNG